MPIQNKAKAVKGIYYYGKKIVRVYNHGVLSWKGGEGYTTTIEPVGIDVYE